MNKIINKKDFTELIEPHFQEDLKRDTYEIEVREPEELLTWNRLDVAFKLIYLEYRNKCENFAKRIYAEHIHALTLGSFSEPGRPDKNSQEKFISEFDQIYESILTSGFEVTKSIIPLSVNGSIANGAHRLASAVYAKKSVATVTIESAPHIYDYQFFYSRNVSLASIELATSKFVETANNVYIALIWPSAVGRDQDIADIIPNIVYRKEVKLNSIGARNLLIKVYHSEHWLGSAENMFKGVDGKLVECFKNFSPLRVIAFQAESIEDVLEIKKNIRNVFNIDKHSIHITDTRQEAIRLSRLLFNENSIHFLNHAATYKYSSTQLALNSLEAFIESKCINRDEFLVDGSLLLSLYGIRESKDIDYLSLNGSLASDGFAGINSHEEDLKYHDKDKASLIFNPMFHFYYDDFKIISFKQLYQMKKNRAEEKDVNDIKLMDAMIHKDYFGKIIGHIRQKWYYLKINFKIKTIEILKAIGLYEMTKQTYRKITKKF